MALVPRLDDCAGVLLSKNRYAAALAAAIALVLAMALPERAAADGDSPAACSRVAYGRPAAAEPSPAIAPNPDGPTVVGIGVFVTGLREIDAVRDDFRFRGYVRATWCDPRLAFEPVAGVRPERVFAGPEAEQELGRIWSPTGFPVNSVGDFSILERVLRIQADGTVLNDLNFSALLSADYDLRRFPFDSQLLELQIESFRWNRDDLVFVADEDSIGFGRDFEIPEWRITRVASRIVEETAIRNPVPFSRFVLEIGVEREPGFYLWKVMLPILIIVGLSWSVFWMTDERLAGRSRITATGVLTIVAYQFVIADDLPRIAYLTLLDKMTLISFGLLSVTVIQSMVVSRFQPHDMARARSIDRTSRWTFPLAYAAMLALLLAGV